MKDEIMKGDAGMRKAATDCGTPDAPRALDWISSIVGRMPGVGRLLAGVLLPMTLVSAGAAPVHHGVSAGLLNVVQVPNIDDNTNCTVSTAFSVNNFQVFSFNRADYSVRMSVGLDASLDVERGVLMTSVAENGRNNFGTNAYPTSAFDTNGFSYRIVSFIGLAGGAGNAAEYNVNVAGAWFPYDRYLGGFARNSERVNGGVNDLFTGSPGLVLGTHFKSSGTGRSIVDLRSFGIDSRTDGVLLVAHAKDENNFALSQANNADGTWNLFIRDNAQTSATTLEQDPVAFVFVPITNQHLVCGKFLGNGDLVLHTGRTGFISVTVLGTGRWELRINGHSPDSGVLIISPEGGGSLNWNNSVSYQRNATGTGWIIESRDTPSNVLQSVGTEPVVSFVFVPAPSPGFTVAPTNGLITVGGGGTDFFDVVLHSRPTAEVRLGLFSTDPSLGLPTPSLLRFNSNTWHVPQIVKVIGQSNNSVTVDTPYAVRFANALSSDSSYQGTKPGDVPVTFVPARASAVFPPPNRTETGISAGLKVSVTNSTSEELSVTFFGREAAPDPGEDFTVVLLPDTQNYAAERSGGKKEMFISQVEWIIGNREPRNIVYVSQLGDIVNDGDIYQGLPNLTQWRNATNAMYRQEDPVRTKLPHGIPYGVAVGNHEMEPIGDPTGTTKFYNQYFGVGHFQGRSYYGGHYGTNNNNHFDFFSGGGLDFIVIYMEFFNGGDPNVIAWANQVLKTNAHRRAIVVTHNMGNTQTPVVFSAQGAAIYYGLRTNANLFMMLGGHITGEGSRQDIFNGNVVRTFVQDYQGRANGGDGWLRILEFSPSNNVVVAQTYSPWLNRYETDEDSEFFFDYNMQPQGPPPPFKALATNVQVAPGSLAGCAWPGLQPDKSYEWYVTVTDSSGSTVTSPVWRFKTALTNTPPVVANISRTVIGDSATNLILTATDVNGDPLTFELPTLPTRGVLMAWDSTNGVFTYTPARGYRGADRFTFRARDGSSASSSATMNLNVVDPPDLDGNGLPDHWELTYGVTDPDADDDGDGASNRAEYEANTNPTNAASIFRIIGLTPQQNGAMGLTWSAVGGTRYRVEFTDGLSDGNGSPQFHEVVRELSAEMNLTPFGQESIQSFVDDPTITGYSTNSGRYYRIKTVQ